MEVIEICHITSYANLTHNKNTLNSLSGNISLQNLHYSLSYLTSSSSSSDDSPSSDESPQSHESSESVSQDSILYCENSFPHRAPQGLALNLNQCTAQGTPLTKDTCVVSNLRIVLSTSVQTKKCKPDEKFFGWFPISRLVQTVSISKKSNKIK